MITPHDTIYIDDSVRLSNESVRLWDISDDYGYVHDNILHELINYGTLPILLECEYDYATK